MPLAGGWLRDRHTFDTDPHRGVQHKGHDMHTRIIILALLTGCAVEVGTEDALVQALDGGSEVYIEPAYASHLPPHADPETEDDWMEGDAGEPEACGWEDTGDRAIVWCDGVDYFCCTDAELDGPRKHWRPNVCPDFCEPGFVAMEDFHVFGGGDYVQALYCVEDRGQCDP